MVSTTNAQNVEFIKAYGSVNGFDRSDFMNANPDGSLTFTFESNKAWITNPSLDTIHFDTISYQIQRTWNNKFSYIHTMDSTGRIIKSKLLGQMGAVRLCRLPDGDYLIAGGVGKPSNFIDSSLIFNQYIRHENGMIIMARMDKNFNLKWMRQTGKPHSAIGNLYYAENHLFFTASVQDSTEIGGKKFYAQNQNTSYASAILGELNPLNGNVIWGKTINNVFSNLNNNIVYTGNKIFVAAGGGFGGKIGTDTIYPSSLVVFKFDSLGNYEKRYCLRAKHGIVPRGGISTDGKNLYLSGSFVDSVYWKDNETISPCYPTGISYTGGIFAAAITTSFTPKWFFRPKVNYINTSSIFIGCDLKSCVYSGGYLYYHGHTRDELQIDSNLIKVDQGQLNLVVIKSDILGNILWSFGAKSTRIYASAMSAQAGKGVYFAGDYMTDTIAFKNKWAVSPGSSITPNGFVSKLSDNAIIRGAVKAGPYCAGDSISIPYTKIGSYDTANYFMAQLSNEEGNFTQGYVNLGRIKSNKNGTIKGKIPLSNISSSGKYRIRIMSTLPAVQSYYKADTLRLLIYSRDKAFAGGDTAICPNDTVQLRTYGGTLWQWSPNYYLQDSSNYKTKAYPPKTTRYRIVISDSSGCGAADTAYKTITVRNSPKINIRTKKDTAVCLGATVPIIATFHQGDSTSYSYNWYSISPTGNYTELKTGSRKLKDTLFYQMPIGLKDSQRLILFLTDGCNKKTDFAFYTIFISKTKTKASLAKDTMVCPNTTANIVAKFTQGNSGSNYNWRWYDVPKTGSWIALSPTISKKTADTLRYTLALGAKAKKIGIRLLDNCTGLADTVYQTITPADTLSLKLNVQDTQLCKGKQHSFKAIGKGGYAKGYKYTWIINTNDTLSKTDSLLYTANTTSSITLTLSDGCMAKAISKQLNITVSPAISSTIQHNNTALRDTNICYGSSLSLLANAQGGKGSGYAYQWLINNNSLFGNSNNIVITPSQYTQDTGGRLLLSLITTDNCTTLPDTATIQLTVLPKLQLQAWYKDSLCYKSTSTIWLKAKGGRANAYQYQWLNAQLQPLPSSADSLPITYTTANQSGLYTYYAIVSDGCSAPDTTTISYRLLPPLALNISSNNTCPAYSSLLKANITGGKGYGYQVQWWRNGQLLSSSKDTLTAYTQGQANTYQAIVKDNCSTVSDTAILQLGVMPNIQLIADKDSGCAPFYLTYNIVSNYQQAFNWTLYTGNNNDSISGNHTQISPTVLYNAGLYTAKLKVQTATGCQAIVNSNAIWVHPAPIAKFWQSTYNLTLNYPELKLENRSSNAAQYQWLYPPIGSSTNTDLTIKYSDTGIYTITLIAISPHNCTDTITSTIAVSNDLQILMPNAFTPNGDNVNDVFKPIGVGIQKLQISIYNRWGELMYSSNDKNAAWDGTFMGKEVQQGAYLYFIEAKGLYGTFQYFKGMVMLNR